MQHYAYEICAIALSCMGLLNVLLQRDLIRKSLGINLFGTGIFLFFAARGYLTGGLAPILDAKTRLAPVLSVNPIPAALILTGIVVSVSMTAFFLALCLRIHRRYGTLDLDEVFLRSAHEEAALMEAAQQGEGQAAPQEGQEKDEEGG